LLVVKKQSEDYQYAVTTELSSEMSLGTASWSYSKNKKYIPPKHISWS